MAADLARAPEARRCPYCGGQALGATCAGHSDLPPLDALNVLADLDLQNDLGATISPAVTRRAFGHERSGIFLTPAEVEALGRRQVRHGSPLLSDCWPSRRTGWSFICDGCGWFSPVMRYRLGAESHKRDHDCTSDPRMAEGATLAALPAEKIGGSA